MDAIEIHGLTKRFNGFTALDSLDLNIKEGSCVGFLGPNGAGKTTTIKIITGLIKPTRGTAYFNGVDVVKDSEKSLLHVGTIVETPEFYSYLTPRETLRYLGRIRNMPHNEIEKRSLEVLYKVNMLQWRNKRIGTFSKGMKQRLSIAQAILHNPSILILDEPTSGLDPRGMFEVRELIKDLNREGMTVFMSSHLLNEVQEVCDTVALMNHGKLLSFKKIKSLDGSQNRVFEVGLLSDLDTKKINKLKAMPAIDTFNINNSTLTIETKCSKDEQAQLVDELSKAKIGMTYFKPKETVLEELYLKSVGSEESI